MAGLRDVLGDDRPLVELRRDVVGGGTDHFDAALVGLVVGPRAGEGGQERVVDVDYLIPVACDKFLPDQLHIAGEDDEIDTLVFEQRDDLFLRGGLRLRADLVAAVLDAEVARDRRQVVVVADDERYLGLELAHLPAGEQVVEAVRQLGDEDGDTRGAVGEVKAPGHTKTLGYRLERLLYLLPRDGEAV